MNSKIIIKGNLVSRTAVHIGSGKQDVVLDSPVFRNSLGELVIPGTSIAGALRGLATEIAPFIFGNACLAIKEKIDKTVCDCETCSLFGSIAFGPSSYDQIEGNSSKIWIYDAPLLIDQSTNIRDRVGIDRETESAAIIARAKYDLEVIPKDSKFDFTIELHGDEKNQEKNEILLAAILSEWMYGRCFIGGRKSSGLSAFILQDVKVYEIDFNDPNQLMAYLRTDDPTENVSVSDNWLENKLKLARERLIKQKTFENGLKTTYETFLQIKFILNFSGELVINNRMLSLLTNFDFAPFMENEIFVIPGSTLKGIIRSHAERIARTIATLKSENKEQFIAICPACNPIASLDEPLTSCGNLITKFLKDEKTKKQDYLNDLCLACKFFGSLINIGKIYVEDAYIVNQPEIKIRDFLAIDRFTGGGKEGAKFDAITLLNPKFSVQLFIKNPEMWELGWLILVLRDLKEGLITIGYGKSKNFGACTIEKEQFKFGTLRKENQQLGLKLDDALSVEGIFKVYSWSFDQLKSIEENPIQKWITAFNEKLTEYSRTSKMRNIDDSYFGRDNLETLYPKEVKL